MRDLARVLLGVLLFSTTAAAHAADLTPQPKSLPCQRLLTPALSKDWVSRMIARGRARDAASKRLREVVQRQGFSAAAINAEILKRHDERYTHELAQGPVTNQSQSGRCWIFAGLNMLRSRLIAEGKVPADFEFSEAYLHFFNMLEKSNTYLERVVKLPRGEIELGELKARLRPDSIIDDGGWFEWFNFLVAKYGLVPKSVMPETRSSENTRLLNVELRKYLSEVGGEVLVEIQRIADARSAASTKGGKPPSLRAELKRLREIKERGMRGVWKILATHLGDPPAEFEVRAEGVKQKQGLVTISPTVVRSGITPRQFATGLLQYNPRDFVVVTVNPLFKKGMVFEAKNSGIGAAEPGAGKLNLKILNVDSKRLEELAMASINGGQPVWFAADVTRDIDHTTGIMHPRVFQREPLYGLEKDEDVSALHPQGQVLFSVNQPNHAMVLTGYDRPDPKGPVLKFKVENSWGQAVGQRGLYHLYRGWFHQHVQQIIVHRSFLSPEEQKLWESEPIQLAEGQEFFGPR